MTNPYANYFYLFNEPPTKGSLLYREPPSAGGEAQAYMANLGFTNVVGGDTLDCPNAATITQRTSSFGYLLNQGYVSAFSLEGKDGVTALERKFSRDPGSNPGNKSIMDVFSHPTYTYRTAYEEPYKFYFNFTENILNDSVAKVRTGHGITPNPEPSDRYTKLVQKGNARDFKFSQRIKLRIEDLKIQGDSIDFKAENHAAGNIEQSIKDFFAIYMLTVSGQSYVIDTNTLFGVPYDYNTVLVDTPQAKTNGVVTRQPFYHQVYNYYDAQYEPVAMSIIEDNISDEKALPSIYDFLYMSVQEQVGGFLMMPGMSYDEINLGGLNIYLDSFARAYENYAQLPAVTAAEAFTVNAEEGIIETSFPGNPGVALALGTLVKDANIDKDALLANNDLKIKATSHTAALKSFKSLTEDQQQIVNIKKNSFPQWINELKTGIYFSDNSYDIFNQALDKEFAFPWFIKVDLPTETVGPLTKIFKENNLLDSLNSYVASKTIPTTGVDAVYSNYYGGVLSGEAIGMNNAVDELKLNNIKLILSPKPLDPDITDEEVTSDEDEGSTGNVPGSGTDEAPAGLGDQPGDTPAPKKQEEQDDTDIVFSAVPYSTANWYKKMPTAFAQVMDLLISQKLKESESVKLIAERLALLQIVYQNLGLSTSEEIGSAVKDPGVKLALEETEEKILESITTTTVTNYRAHGFYLNSGFLYDPQSIAEGTSPTLEATEDAQKEIDLMVVEEMKKYVPLQDAIKKLKSEGTKPDPYLPMAANKSGLYLSFMGAQKKVEAIMQGATKIHDAIEAAKKAAKLNWGGLIDPVTPADIYLDDLVENSLEGVFTYLDEGDENTLPSGDFGKLIKKLKVQNLKKDISQLLIKDTTGLLRGPGEILDGELAHNETLMYEIAKYRVGEDGNEVFIQSIFLPITHQDKLTYYDTQVIPFQDYFYKIFAHKVILGTRYRIGRSEKLESEIEYVGYDYKMVVGAPEYYSKIELSYDVEPYLQIVRVPYYNTTTINLAADVINHTRIEDTPPLPPQVNFVPFRNVKDKILILLQNSIGGYEAYPRVIYPTTDQEIFTKIYSSQDKTLDSKILFRSDDSQGTFEIYRLDGPEPPESYIDFQNTPTPDITELYYFGDERNDSHVDAIEPNKVYYYTVRFTDIHGNISNPTDIYKIKIVAQTGAMPYLTVETMDIREIQKKNYNEQFPSAKKMKKYLYMKPNYIQTSIMPPAGDAEIEGSYADYPLKLGADFVGEGGINPSIFGKKFKLRITSKQTGKKIDINLNVKEPQEIIINE